MFVWLGCREIQTHYQYLDTGMQSVNQMLDTQWDSYQLSKNGSK